MEGFPRKDEDGCHQFLDLVPKERKWMVVKKEEETNHGYLEETKLELRLGPPTGDWTIHESVPSLGKFPYCKKDVLKTPWQQSLVPETKDASHPCHSRGAENTALSSAPGNKNVQNTSSAQKRTAPGPVVGWPPIRSLRKNLASGNSTKLASESPDVIQDNVCDKKPVDNSPKSSKFVKINMDGIPIGRKVDLMAYDSYAKLSYAVDELFRGLIAALRDGMIGEDPESLVKENGEYTLVYEDNDGDRMLVGDVPWHMFVSTVKRLRVLRSSDLPALTRKV